MKIVIVGAGEVGFHIAKQLTEEGKDVVLIEKDPETAKYASNTLDCLVIKGEGTHMEVLKDAGTGSADIFVAATTSDEVNLISCFVVASEFQVPVKIARVRSVEYTQRRAFSTNFSGVDYLVNPDREAAWEIAQTVEQGATSTITVFHRTDIQMRDYYVDEGSYFTDKTVKDIRMGLKEYLLITSVARDGELQIPNGDFEVKDGDSLHIVAHKSTFQKIHRKIGYKTDKLRKIAIVGGTPIGMAVAELLVAKGRSIVIIDKNYEHCKFIADELPEATVINADISDHELYAEEGLYKMDAVVGATQNEELNILSGVYAKTLGVKRVVAVVEKTSYLTIAGSIGIDSTVSPKFSVINTILKFIRKGRVRSVYSVFDGQAEAIDINIGENSRLTGKPIKDLHLPPDCLLAAVNRGRKSIIPDGNLELRPGDNAIFFAKRHSIPELERLLA
ncbi:MAG: Trk system potassium transporter TrkA [Deferribacteraceae bacterium]|jgi:trk system potassium uptake protein TrkA|nr:Trk system potassium transporter TrkA [Deferribacteraceae bacterium]